ncbi:hypothetical protein DSM106972_095110 [Dulcicalothrix desertica PCC 7102]|uniref:Uncharacterized protein n=1 Tax=Dulcicalothrix desertica PCC 7102 TaxID=232991 RepID=A0A433UJB6_9CYAN|nr:hypothetical protein [Dulcicalothrix desertica]RUS93912.1 hypothetical protein DSM106972_095110 [Dulcicalothrix desertica PCC 7102]TWH61601.1 hypothetical protein CAL7102_00823 [Dulcicalothrix desertica PCC 7102]
MANKLLNFRCPETLLEAIDKIGQEYYPADNDSGCDRSKTLIDILMAGVEALTNGEVVLQKPGTVKQDVRQVTEADIKAMVEVVVGEKLSHLPVQNSVQTPVQNISNIPTRNEFHDLKEQVNTYKLGLMREIQNRDKSINLLAEQVAELTARLDAAPQSGTVSPEVLETAKEAVLRKWRVAKAPEKKERIEQALDKFIDAISPPEPKPETETKDVAGGETKNNDFKPDSITDIRTNIKKKKPLTAWEEWEEICTDNIIELDELWHEK